MSKPEPLVFAIALVAFASPLAFAADKAMVSLADEVARQRVVGAMQAIELGSFDRGLPVLQQTVESSENRLVPVPPRMDMPFAELREALSRDSMAPAVDDAVAGKPTSATKTAATAAGRRFLSLRLLGRCVLKTLPPPAIQAYRSRYDRIAERLYTSFERSADHRLLERLSRQLFLTPSGGVARETLADRFFEAGRYRDAAAVYRSLAFDKPTTTLPLNRLRLKLLLSLRLAGNEELYTLLRDRILKEVSAAGRSDSAGFLESLDKLASDVPLVPLDERPPPPSPSRWGGELTSGRLPDLPSGLLTLSWDSMAWSAAGGIVEPVPTLRVTDPRGMRLSQLRMLHAPSVDYPFVPLADAGRIYVSGVFGIYCLDGRPGVGRLLRASPKPDYAVIKGTYRFKESSNSPIYALTLWKRDREPECKLDAKIPAELLIGHYVSRLVTDPGFMSYEVKGEIPTRALVAIDPTTGREFWRTAERLQISRVLRESGDYLAPTDDLASISYTSPVIVEGGRVFAAGWNQEGFVNSRVRALDLKTGKILWDTLVCSSQMELTLFGEVAREPFASFLVDDGDVVYAQTNLGAVAALEKTTGKIRWLTTYDTLPTGRTRGPIVRKRRLYWGLNPPYLMGHILIVTPRDSKYLYAIDTGRGPEGEGASGRILWTVDNTREDMRDLLGSHERKLYFTGRPGVSRLDLRAMTSSGTFLAGQAPRREIMGGTFPRDTVPARGILTSSGVVFADRRRLWLVDWAFERPRPLMATNFPPARRGSYLFPGRVQVVGNLVLVTSNRLLSAYGPVSD